MVSVCSTSASLVLIGFESALATPPKPSIMPETAAARNADFFMAWNFPAPEGSPQASDLRKRSHVECIRIELGRARPDARLVSCSKLSAELFPPELCELKRSDQTLRHQVLADRFVLFSEDGAGGVDQAAARHDRR